MYFDYRGVEVMYCQVIGGSVGSESDAIGNVGVDHHARGLQGEGGDDLSGLGGMWGMVPLGLFCWG